MEKQKFPKIYIINIGGGHGHFLTYVLDRFCNQTPAITKSPFTELGTSHNEINYSGQFVFCDVGQVDSNLKFKNENLIFIDIDDEVLYFERVAMSRAGDANTDLFSEEAIAKFLRDNGSTFPDYCESKNISLKQGYMYSFMDMNKQGSVVRNKKRLDRLKNNNLFRYSLKNFYTMSAFEKSIVDIGAHFGINFDTNGIPEIYKEFRDKNKILQSHNAVREYMYGNKDVQLDIIQQAFVDAQKK